MRAVIAAIIGPTGRATVDPDRVSALNARAKLPRAETPQIEVDGPLALIRIPIRPSNRGRIRSESGVRVVLDGTVDNRIDLAREMGLSCAAESEVSSEQVVAIAYERWGEDSPAKLIGEFAFVLWDPQKRRLFAARDALGARQLFYTLSTPEQGELHLASQLHMLQDSFQVSDVDEEYVADFLVRQVHIGPRTMFRHIHRIQAGHWLSWRNGRLETRRYWEPTEQSPLTDESENSVAERFREMFREAVDRCLRTGGRTWAELSGGMDSSSIVCMAQEILGAGSERSATFRTVSFVWDETPQCDERRWMQPVIDKYGLANDQLVSDDLFFDDMLEASRYRSDPHFGLLCYPMYRKEEEHLRKAGVDTLLSGSRAESVVLSDETPPLHLADLLRAGRFGAFFRTLSRWQRGTHKPMINLAYSFGLRPLLRPNLYLRSSEDRGVVDPWVHPDFARRFELRDRARKSLLQSHLPSRAQTLQAERLLRSEQMVARGSLEWSCEVRHPFVYRPLVELALRIPWEEKVEPDLSKPLLRRALKGILPEQVRTRKGGRGPGPSAYKAFARRWPKIEPVVRSPLLASLGFVDPDEFHRAAEMIRFGASPKFGAYTTCLGLEYWLRAAVGEDETA